MQDLELLYESFLKTECEKRVVCPYCLKDNQLDPPLLCCSEVHASERLFWNDEPLETDKEIKEAFWQWIGAWNEKREDTDR